VANSFRKNVLITKNTLKKELKNMNCLDWDLNPRPLASYMDVLPLNQGDVIRKQFETKISV
jgi:archaellum biogenesis ATPase FlaH